MKRIRLTDVQCLKIELATSNARDVLREIKLHKLKGRALKDIKFLEDALDLLECFYLGKWGFIGK